MVNTSPTPNPNFFIDNNTCQMMMVAVIFVPNNSCGNGLMNQPNFIYKVGD